MKKAFALLMTVALLCALSWTSVSANEFDAVFDGSDIVDWAANYSFATGRDIEIIKAYLVESHHLWARIAETDLDGMANNVIGIVGISTDIAAHNGIADREAFDAVFAAVEGGYMYLLERYGYDLSDEILQSEAEKHGYTERLRNWASYDYAIFRLYAILDQSSDIIGAAVTAFESEAFPANDLVTDSNAYPAGMYKIGSDLPAGTYFLTADPDAIISTSTVLDGSSSDANMLSFMTFDAFAIIGVREGEYLEITDATISDYAASKAITDAAIAEGITDGMYEVGFHIEAGEYKTSANEDAYLPSITVYADPYQDKMIDFKLVDGSGYITLRDGQFLQLDDVTLTK